MYNANDYPAHKMNNILIDNNKKLQCIKHMNLTGPVFFFYTKYGHKGLNKYVQEDSWLSLRTWE